MEIHRLFGAQMHALRDGHEQRHPYPQRSKDDVEGQRHGHLRASEEEITHSITGWQVSGSNQPVGRLAVKFEHSGEGFEQLHQPHSTTDFDDAELPPSLFSAGNFHIALVVVCADVLKPRLGVEHSTIFRCHWRADRLSQQRHATHSLLSLSRFRRSRPRECDVGTIIVPEAKVMKYSKPFLNMYEQ